MGRRQSLLSRDSSSHRVSPRPIRPSPLARLRVTTMRVRHSAAAAASTGGNLLAARVAVAALASSLALAPIVAVGAVLLDFEGVVDRDKVGTFYSGGGGGPSKNYGITFGASALGVVDSDAGRGTGNFANEPSPNTTLLVEVDETQVSVFTAPGGFTGLSFQYSSNNPLTATAYDGPDRTGTALGATSLPQTGSCDDCGDPGGFYGVWFNVTLAFSGVAKSVAFSTTAPSAFVFIDDMIVALVPTNPPTKSPTTMPPTRSPTKAPTKRPTKGPSLRPTRFPTNVPVQTMVCPRKGMKGNNKCMMMMLQMKVR
jgi:hypothetical protein